MAVAGDRNQTLGLGSQGTLSPDAALAAPVTIASPQDCGMAGGEYCAIWLGPELPGDQRVDDGKSVCFDGAPLDAPLDIVGAPVVRLKLAADRPRAMVAVRLCDVQPDGASTRITYGVLQPVPPQRPRISRSRRARARRWKSRVKLDDVAYSVAPGHRLRVAISSTYWPMVWPSPEPVTLTLHQGSLDLPVRASGGGDESRVRRARRRNALGRSKLCAKAANSRVVERDEATGTVTLAIVDDFGEVRELEPRPGRPAASPARRWTIDPADPLSAYGETHWTQTLSRKGWSVRTETCTTMRSDAENFHLTGRIEAFEGDRLVFERDFEETIARDHI